MRPSVWQLTLALTAGVLTVSAAAIFIRLAFQAAGASGAGISLLLAATRLTIAALLLLPAWRGLRPARLQPGAVRYAVFAGVFLALHFASWITSLAYTSIAASVTLVTTNPVWVALIGWIWWRERLSRTTLAGVCVALAGGILIGLGDAGNAPHTARNPLLGDALALLGAIAASFYFLLGREAQRRGLSIGQYAAIAYGTAALVLLPLPALAQTPYLGWPAGFYLWAFAMAVSSQLIGHTSFNWAVRWMNPTLVTLVILLEPVGSSLLGYLVFGEVPGRTVLLGAAILLSGVALAIWGNRTPSAREARTGSR
ncbi:DMT family transporter [Marinithermus hydrothermalis]|uniref:EamA domain-containing protein n=1 Tax=Marinithermus hydrothermalis (strain DSM 14884 / JCM 11576 / T1) TaxID=869210 RepID=F2NNR5_MARHT|nr:DMT family transporter [Marinithermus hydrothermalis]AEB11289.1 protein of unknown function DUF6 transmembrane [Marinithermus hydrothermalis DSM 14884]